MATNGRATKSKKPTAPFTYGMMPLSTFGMMCHLAEHPEIFEASPGDRFSIENGELYVYYPDVKSKDTVCKVPPDLEVTDLSIALMGGHDDFPRRWVGPKETVDRLNDLENQITDLKEEVLNILGGRS